MSDRNDGGPAFPVEHTHDGMPWVNPGMTLRDWFAGQAILTAYNDLRADERDKTRRTLNSGKDLLTFSDVFTHPDHIAEVAYDIADAMIAQRAKAEART